MLDYVRKVTSNGTLPSPLFINEPLNMNVQMDHFHPPHLSMNSWMQMFEQTTSTHLSNKPSNVNVQIDHFHLPHLSTNSWTWTLKQTTSTCLIHQWAIECKCSNGPTPPASSIDKQLNMTIWTDHFYLPHPSNQLLNVSLPGNELQLWHSHVF